MALKINFVFDTESRHTKVSVQGVKSLWGDCSVFPRLGAQDTDSNQITVVAFQSVQLAQASFLQKNQMLQNGFLITATLRWHRASVAWKNQSL